MEKLLTVSEAAGVLKIAESTLYQWSYRRQIPSQKVGKSLRFSVHDLENWLRQQARPAFVNCNE
jgi:excisionase family DNA binding protein